MTIPLTITLNVVIPDALPDDTLRPIIQEHITNALDEFIGTGRYPGDVITHYYFTDIVVKETPEPTP